MSPSENHGFQSFKLDMTIMLIFYFNILKLFMSVCETHMKSFLSLMKSSADDSELKH